MRHSSKAALIAAATVTVLAFPLQGGAGAIPLPPPLGPCGGPNCPAVYPPVSNGDFAGRDANINVFTGGDYTVTGRAAEVEGWVVTLGNLLVDKNGGGLFNMGVVGVGSRVPPPNGTDFVSVGGNVTVRPANEVMVGGSDSKGPAYGDVRYGGTLTGKVTVVAPGSTIHDAGVRATYAPLRTTIEDFSQCAAQATATGTVTVTPSTPPSPATAPAPARSSTSRRTWARRPGRST